MIQQSVNQLLGIVAATSRTSDLYKTNTQFANLQREQKNLEGVKAFQKGKKGVREVNQQLLENAKEQFYTKPTEATYGQYSQLKKAYGKKVDGNKITANKMQDRLNQNQIRGQFFAGLYDQYGNLIPKEGK